MRKFGLTKSEIIRNAGHFTLIFQTGRFLRGRFFDVIYMKSDKRQVGFATSRYVRTAVKRNRIKRMLREAYRLEKMSFHDRLSLILIGRDEVANAPLDQLRQEMRVMAKRIHEQL